MASDPDRRSERLGAFFSSVVHGRRSINNVADAQRYFEAICVQDDHTRCVERILASPDALKALKTGLRVDTSPSFINTSTATFLRYLSEPLLKQLCQGQFLQQLLIIIVDPPTLVNALSSLLDRQELGESSVYGFAWLVNELLVLSTTQSLDLDITALATRLHGERVFLTSSIHDIRVLGYKIEKFLELRSPTAQNTTAASPGGRHDNDFADFRKVEILPTGDELVSQELAFYRRAEDVMEEPSETRAAAHLDNQFRLLREDMLGELRLDLQVALGQSTARRQIMQLRDLQLVGPHFDEEKKRRPLALRFLCASGIPKLSALPDNKSRAAYLSDNRNFLKHQSVGCFLQHNQVVAFATVDRNDELLAQSKPYVVLQVSGHKPFQNVLMAAKSQSALDFVLVGTPIFAYEPVLKRLQHKTDFNLADDILSFGPDGAVRDSPLATNHIRQLIQDNDGQNLDVHMNLPKQVSLDQSQTRALSTALGRAVSIIQGPPGTGKSFIGALSAKAILDSTSQTILVICFTNHALDQFLEDLMDIGIRQEDMVRLGSKSSARTEHLSLFNQQIRHGKSREEYEMLMELRQKLNLIEDSLEKRMDQFKNYRVNGSSLLAHLEFSEDESHFYDAFTVPYNDDGMSIVDKRGRKIDKFYLLDQWKAGRDAGVFQEQVNPEHHTIWELSVPTRQKLLQKWQTAILNEQNESIAQLFKDYNNAQSSLLGLEKIQRNETIKQKRVIGCTTTAAAKYASEIQAAVPGVIIVEEAGEILESHILTAMSESTKHMVLIGDHKQLRPKNNNYELSVEKGSGFDLNRSLFERLVLAEYPCETLRKQHRMPPEVSKYVRQLTYPHLEDASPTLTRPKLRGIQSRVVFVNHEHPEMEQEGVADKLDQGSRTSKRNMHEAEMVLRCVRYLGQQGYGTDKIVVLTPYLGQLSLLRRQLSKENDPVLNDLDSFDLINAGLMTAASAAQLKRPLRLSTIDNYQGEECDIVVGSLTRSNDSGDVGFMGAPERLNVLLSRARVGLILFGNAATFLKSRRGKGTWTPFVEMLKENGHLYDGLPIQCERHALKLAILKCREDFDLYCPDGGCSEPCGSRLNCGQHDCPQKCHQLYDHSKVDCTHIVDVVCPVGHKKQIRCSRRSVFVCRTCADEAARQEKRRQRDQHLEDVREERQRRHAAKMAEIQDEIEHERRILRNRGEDSDRASALQQRQKDLENARKQARKMKESKAKAATTSTQAPVDAEQRLPEQVAPSSVCESGAEKSFLPTPEEPDASESEAKKDWEHRKHIQGEECDALDELMEMIGLEDIKDRFLSIKDKVDLAVRQNIGLKQERFSASLLGNPGTGKTTVARLYARFLTSVGALPGDVLKETTGSSLASEGVRGCKSTIEEILNQGGGALFIDEAYQLASGQNPGGGSVLDFLLAEVENLRGKVVFILAGYNKQMEAFFAHNPGLPSRFPHELPFQDYTDEQLLRILQAQLVKRYGGRMRVADGTNGLYARIVARRLGKGRGKDGFGNARAVENALSRIIDRQVKRLRKARRKGDEVEDMYLTQEDLIGPEPTGTLTNSHAWNKVQQMIGLTSVKESVKALLEVIEQNYQRELQEHPPLKFTFNRVFLGSPGTGKTTVAKLYGQILADLGFLSNGEVVIKTPADFVGAVLGESEKNTKGILAASIGKVLVIDEAYGLCGVGPGVTDPYKTAVIDTIVAEVQSTPGEDRCVLLLGYRDQMQSMFQAVNPGLSRRFPLDSAFDFEDFSDDELKQILQLKLRQQGLQATDQGKRVAMDVLQRARNRPNFGNAGEIDILLNNAKSCLQKRRTGADPKGASTLQPEDFDKDFDRSARAATNIRMLFTDVVGSQRVIEQLEKYQRIAARLKTLDMDPREHIPFNFLFRGPPGTGKTTTARKMGKVYYDMGFLATAEVIESSASELVAGYVGQTGEKTQKLLTKGLGKVLFIDEAYRLAEGGFAKEAMDEIVDCLTKPKFAQKLVVILAGYDNDINRLMSINPGLSSRFPETIVFESLSSQTCVELLTQLLAKKKKAIDVTVLTERSQSFEAQLLLPFETLRQTSNWANARDIQTLSKAIFSNAISSSDLSSRVKLDQTMILAQIQAMVDERSQRTASVLQWPETTTRDPILPEQTANLPGMKASHIIDVAQAPPQQKQADPESEAGSMMDREDDQRDANVSDAVWATLMQDKEAAKQKEVEYTKFVQDEQKHELELRVIKEREDALELQAKAMRDDEGKRRIEEERIRNELERRAKEAERAAIERKRRDAEEARKKEAVAQKKLRSMGVCVAGFRWIKQAEGYRCAGGSHFISNAELDRVQ